MSGFNGVQRSNYLGIEPVKRTKVEVIVRKVTKGKARGNEKATGEIIKGGGDIVVN